MRHLVLTLVTLLALLAPAAPALAAAPACRFVLGFAALQALDPADTGACVDNQAFAANGDALQHTTKGLMAWRKADNWTAFTDGYHTWIDGPFGLGERLNGQRFMWEVIPGTGWWAHPDLTGEPTSVAPDSAAKPCFPAPATPVAILMAAYQTDGRGVAAYWCSDIISVLSPALVPAVLGYVDADAFCRCQNSFSPDVREIDDSRYLVSLSGSAGVQIQFMAHLQQQGAGWIITDIRCGNDLPNTSLLVDRGADCEVTPASAVSPGAANAAAATAPGAPFAGVNWDAVLRHDPHFHASQQALLDGMAPSLYLESVATDPDSGLSSAAGWPDLADTVYGSLDGRGLDMAAIGLGTGGTIGDDGVLIYRAGPGGPALFAILPDVRTAPQFDGQSLLTFRGIYGPSDPQCCPGQQVVTTIQLQDGKLAVTGTRTRAMTYDS